jgi:hypothetical protein
MPGRNKCKGTNINDWDFYKKGRIINANWKIGHREPQS